MYRRFLWMLPCLCFCMGAGPTTQPKSSSSSTGSQPSSPTSPASAHGSQSSDFFLLRYDESPQHLEKICQQALKQANHAMNELVRIHNKKTPTFSSMVVTFEKAVSNIDEDLGHFYLLKYASSRADIRKAATRCLIPVTTFYSQLFARADLYQLMQKVGSSTQSLDSTDLRLYTETSKSFQRSGAGFPTEQRKKIAALNSKISLLSMKFSSNLSQDQTTVALAPAELKGVPASILQQLKTNKQGHYLLQPRIASHYLSILKHAQLPLVRKKVLLAHGNIQAQQNTPLLEEILQLRYDMARLMGYASFAHFELDDRMAKTPARVFAFLRDLQPKLREKMDRELQELLALKRKEFPQATHIDAWDWRYYANQLMKTKYAVDSEQIRAYFPVDHVIQSVFEIYQTLLGVRFLEIKPARAWHPDVRLFAIENDLSHGAIAYFYLDLYPRAGKYSHFAAFPMRNGHQIDAVTYRKPISAVVGNWPKATSGKPALLSHSEVETFFHEFGHIMHQTLTTARYASMAGTSVKTDFVEAPSQMLENWVWQRPMLKKISRHYQTAQPLPDDLIDKMLRARYATSGLFWSRQLFFAMVDMVYHTQAGKVDTASLWRQVVKQVMPVAYTEGTRPAASFGHLTGYAAGYYGYLWSKVFSADMFTLFQQRGLLDLTAGLHYRRWILAPGGTRDPNLLLRQFLGRDPSIQAFYKELGLP